MLAGLAEGTTRLSNFSTGADPHSSLACMEALGATVVRRARIRAIEVTGAGGAFHPACGGAGLRQLRVDDADAGWADCSASAYVHLDRRSLADAAADGAHPQATGADGREDGAGGWTCSDHDPRRAAQGDRLRYSDSRAQVKTAVLFAGLQAEGTTSLSESVRTRDHSEHALRAFGATLTRDGREAEHRGWAEAQGD